MGIRVSPAYGEHLVVAAADGTGILRYVHRPDPDPFEPPEPYAHSTLVRAHAPENLDQKPAIHASPGLTR
ncbi:hypothetical protein [Streptomyces gilvus]|uniref:hypothetical protein n=1 Tax=Streptomyces gilvus TaxID=2920937 RepID=UPI0027E4855A|nr:hypothetical protein [Streptomyces sp. CME 23]